MNQPSSVIAAWQALYRHSKSPHWSSLTMVSGTIIIIIIIIIVCVAIYLWTSNALLQSKTYWLNTSPNKYHEFRLKRTYFEEREPFRGKRRGQNIDYTNIACRVNKNHAVAREQFALKLKLRRQHRPRCITVLRPGLRAAQPVPGSAILWHGPNGLLLLLLLLLL